MQITTHIIMKDGQTYIEGKEHLKAEMVAHMYVDGDYSIDEVMSHYHLTAAEVHAALSYFYDNRDELEAAQARVLTEIHENAMTLEKVQAKIAARKSNDEGSSKKYTSVSPSL